MNHDLIFYVEVSIVSIKLKCVKDKYFGTDKKQGFRDLNQ